MNQRLADIIEKATCNLSLSHEEIVYLLSLKDTKSIQRLMSAARLVRRKYFEDKIFLYGFVYFSTYCRNHCSFCFYRKMNKQSPRYRKSLDEILEVTHKLVNSGVHLVDLTMGEDPLIHETGNFQIVVEMIARVKKNTGIPVMISPGVVPDEILEDLSRVKTDWYALYQETHNPILFKNLRKGQSYEERIAKRTTAHRVGMLVEDGILLGVGETISDRADSIIAMRQNRVHQARVMSFVPQPQTPLGGSSSPSRMIEYLCIAVMRLTMPHSLIPASLDVDGIKGLKMRLQAGANVVTSIIPPHRNLAGVSQSVLDIEQGLRSVPEVKATVSSLGLKAARAQEYASWISMAKKKLSTRAERLHEANDLALSVKLSSKE